ncbi:unnamed protein product [Bemisia tabaci]|uniref:Vesicle transport through interaction with t-SNAREs homolog 1A n=1 Tax=Bemisia tabaci TaxID=7038 RepID=A0A9P0G501_BEMTA|nr:PREDICTED: vesicle transport through interaction with t-SNAREs homolog 1A [Bemisia tabaci]CAH0769665.1 unnamed protein product [Bemisia tabaci]
MATLLDNYEQQYAVLTAEITCKIGKLTKSDETEKKNIISELEKSFEEANELMEQMELEIREIDPSFRPRLKTRVDSYKAELSRLLQDFNSAKSSQFKSDGFYNQTDSYKELGNISLEQKQRLLDTSEIIERTGNHLANGYRIVLETEEIGNEVLQNLNSQRETIQKSRSRLRETNANLNRSSRIMNAMIARSLQHRFILLGVGTIFFLTCLYGVYRIFTRIF